MPNSANSAAERAPRRGEVWFADLNPTLGHEQAGRRPILIVSGTAYNTSQAGMVIALPLTSKTRVLLGRVPIRSPEGGLKVASDILCVHVRAISHNRLLRRWGEVTPSTMASVESVLRVFLQL